MKPRRRQLRNKATAAEVILWERLRKRQLKIKFIRQYSVSGYVIDFYAPEIRLAIELDGYYHLSTSQQVYDKYRTRYLNSAGIKEIRFTNEEVVNRINDVVIKIQSSDPLLK